MPKFINHAAESISGAGKFNSAKFKALSLVLMFAGGTMSAQAMLPTPDAALNTSANSVSAKPIHTKTVAAVVRTNAQGNVTLEPVTEATTLKQGDMLEYITYVTNHSNDRVRSVNITMSIPKEVKLIGNIEPSTGYASIDGKNFSRMPLKGKINGEMKVIPLEYFKGLRWTLNDIDLNGQAKVKYRVTVR